jgi:hypothetical protein
VFDRVEMNVVNVPRKVVADGVLPESALPQREIAIWPALQQNSGVKQGGC